MKFLVDGLPVVTIYSERTSLARAPSPIHHLFACAHYAASINVSRIRIAAKITYGLRAEFLYADGQVYSHLVESFWRQLSFDIHDRLQTEEPSEA